MTRRASGRAIGDYLEARRRAARGDRDGTVDALRLALVHDPGSPQLRISYAEALARAGRLDDAEGEARRAMELADSPAAARDAHLVLETIFRDRALASTPVRR